VAGRLSFSARNNPVPDQLPAPNPIDYNRTIAMTKDGMFYINSRVKIVAVSDGTSNTMMFGERQHRDPNFDRMYTNFPIIGWSGWAWVNQENAVGDYLVGACRPINWMIPDDATGPNSSNNTWVRQKLSSMSSGHTAGANVCFGDGSVRFLTNSTQMPALWAMATRNGGETITAD
jgi:prepilin-type processing-associated H-X9-DG protein